VGEIAATATTDHVDGGQLGEQVDVALGQRSFVAPVELGGLVELDVAHGRRVGADAPNAVPRAGSVEDVREVRGVRAVHHEVGGRQAGGAVDLVDRGGERLPRRERTVGLDRERDHDLGPDGACGTDDPDRLGVVVDGERGHQVGAGVVQRCDLGCVIALGVGSGHRRADGVPVATGSDVAADDDRDVRVRVTERGEQLDAPTVDPVECVGVVAEPGAPVGVGAPRGRLDDDPGPVRPRQRNDVLEVLAQQLASLGALDQGERREVGQVDAVVEDEVGLESALADERPTLQLWQRGRPGGMDEV